MRTAVPIGIGGVLILGLLSWATGTDFLSLLNDQGATQVSDSAGPVQSTPQEERKVDLVDAVARDVQNTYEQELGGRYQRTRVVLFRDAIESACGSAESATGPFYCPGDQKVYLDVGFFDELTKRFGAPGEFA
jgi:predicted metalloprotease